MGDAETIQGLAERTGVPASTIRMYQHIGILDPPRREGRVGLYDSKHVRRIETILRFKDMGFSLSGIRALLDPEAREWVLAEVKSDADGEEPISSKTGLSAFIATLEDDESPLHRLTEIADTEHGVLPLEDDDIDKIASDFDISPRVAVEETRYLRGKGEELAQHYWEVLRLHKLDSASPDDEFDPELVAFWVVLLRRAISITFDRAIKRRIADLERRSP